MIEITPELQQKYTNFQLNKLRNHIPNMKECPECLNVFDSQSYVFRPTAIYPRTNKFCSPQCKKVGAGRKNKKIFKEYICSHCQQEFTPNSKKPHQQFCSHTCYSNHLKGTERPVVQTWVHKLRPPKNSISKSEIEWLSQFDVTHKQHIIKIHNKNYRVDGFNELTNTIYEYLGSFWHGNPDIYAKDDIHPICKKTYGELYIATMNRLSLFEQTGFNVVYEWSKR